MQERTGEMVMRKIESREMVEMQKREREVAVKSSRGQRDCSDVIIRGITAGYSFP